MFSYQKNKITFQDTEKNLDLEAPSLEDLKNISKMIFLDGQKSVQKMQKEFDKFIVNKD